MDPEHAASDQDLARQWLLDRLEALRLAGVQQLRRPEMATSQISGSVVEPRPELNPMGAAQSPLPEATRVGETPLVPVPPAPSTPDPAGSAAMPEAPIRPLDLLSVRSQPYPADLPADGPSRQRLLEELAGQVRICQRCRELARYRTQTVFGVGQVCPRVVFFGEAPGADEDRQGEPFVGRAGQLLTKIIEACGWRREEVYIMNVLKCRPPDNRTPLPQEVENCRPFFERQLEILRPEYIVCLGSVSSQALLETTDSVGKLRGCWHRYRGSKVLVTYHPSYLLRNPAAKKYVWEDMQMLLRDMGLPIPRRG